MKTFVNEIDQNQTVQTYFLVINKEVRQKKTGEPYLSLLLGDKTGDIDAKMWDNVAEVLNSFEKDDFVRVRGLVQVFQNRLQLTIHKIQTVTAAEVDAADFYPVSSRDRMEMFSELQRLVASIRNPHLRTLLETIFADGEIALKFRTAPAAKQIHHAFLGGLIEHVLSLAVLAEAAAAHYPFVDRDLLLTGVILHDIGKIHELNYERSISYSDEGQLIGHIPIGMKIVCDKASLLPDFPRPLLMLVEHMILSHHGQLDYGSPKVPLFIEAMLLHQLDNLDSKMETMRAAVANDRQLEGTWTGFVSSLERPVLKKERYLQSSAANASLPADAPAQPEADPSVSAFAAKLQAALRPKC